MVVVDVSEQSLNEYQAISASLNVASPEEILAWAIERYPAPELSMATAFGAEGCVLLSMLSRLPGGKSVRVFNLDTGYQFQETLELRDRIEAELGISVDMIRPEETVAQMETRFGGPIYGLNPDECCRLRKIVPLSSVLRGHSAWITAIRGDQTVHRSYADVVEWDTKFQLVKVNPLLGWTREQVWQYIKINDVPYNRLHDEGYASIGCWPCTRPIEAGEHEREGRWSISSVKTECGLHVKPAAPSNN